MVEETLTGLSRVIDFETVKYVDRLAAIFGTLQSNYPSDEWRKNCEEERFAKLSCGCLQSARALQLGQLIACDCQWQDNGYAHRSLRKRP